MNDLSNEVAEAITAAIPHSDMRPEELLNAALVFCRAHRKVPQGLSIEVGSRRGGSAFMFLKLLEALYPNPRHRPYLVTVDPHGMKPYAGGDHDPVKQEIRPYGDNEYVAMKTLLAPYPNHVHFPLESTDFFPALHDSWLWIHGQSKPLRGACFVLLDGDHAATPVMAELYRCFIHGWVRASGVALVDNADKDPALLPLIERHYLIDERTSGPPGTMQVVISRRRV